LVDAIDDRGNPYRVVGNPIKLPGASRSDVLKVPVLGEHTRAIFCDELGMDPDDYKRLLAEGALAESSD